MTGEQTDIPRAVRITRIESIAECVRQFDLRPVNGLSLPAVDAGAHADLHLPGGLVRPYSLLNPGGPSDHYEVAVRLRPDGEGGSRFLHEAEVGTELGLGGPRNLFPLRRGGGTAVLIAGGIGITPIWSMIRCLRRDGSPWQLHYAGRRRVEMPFLDRLEGDRRVTLYPGDRGSGGRADIERIVATAPDDANFYCCGPPRMIAEFLDASSRRDPARVHVERFNVERLLATAAGHGRAFTLELGRSGIAIAVEPSETILDAVLRAGIPAAYSCRKGICGSCEVPVIAGLPDHRDAVLSSEEKAANRSVMICCARSLSDRLTIDL